MIRITLAVACAVLLAAPSATVFSQDGTPNMRVVAPGELPSDTTTFEVEVMVDNVRNLGAFQFVLTADSTIATAENIVRGDFLGSSGREVYCPEPTIEGGSVRFTCVTLGETPAQGANGSGVLATVSYRAHTDGATPLSLSRVKLNEPPGESIDVVSVDTEVVIDGGGDGANMLLLLGIGAGAAILLVVAAFAILRRRNGKMAVPASTSREPIP